MRDHPSTTQNREQDKYYYRSPTVTKRPKHNGYHARERSISPNPHSNYNRNNRREHRSRKKSIPRTPATNVEYRSKPSYYVQNHNKQNHARPSSSYSSIPLSSKNHKNQKTMSPVHGPTSFLNTTYHITNKHSAQSHPNSSSSPVQSMSGKIQSIIRHESTHIEQTPSILLPHCSPVSSMSEGSDNSTLYENTCGNKPQSSQKLRP